MSSYCMAVSCFLLITVLVYIRPLCSAIAPDDRHHICRTNFRYRTAHDWIPYANATSSGTWKVLIDQHDYQNVLGAGSPPGAWTGRDSDGDGRQVSLWHVHAWLLASWPWSLKKQEILYTYTMLFTKLLCDLITSQ